VTGFHKTGKIVDLRTQLSLLKGGKRVRGSVYIHMDSVTAQNSELAAWLFGIARRAGATPHFNIVRINPSKCQISFLNYPDFRSRAHPALMGSTAVNYEKWTVRRKDYSRSTNRPILHRKETFLKATDADFERFRSLTQAEESAGLLSQVNKIGYENEWARLLKSGAYRVDDHELIHRK
jgi:DNA phosphorothioation-associated putative methyltransferase